MPRYTWIEINDFRGGRNQADAPVMLRDNQVTEMRNGDTYRTPLFRKRGGATKPSIGSVFTSVISSLIAHFPDNNPANAELWGVDSAATPIIGRMAGATTFSAPTLKDNPATGAGPKVRGASYNGKLFLAYDSAVDRLQVYDPNLGSPSVRRVGLDTPAAPTVANTGAGTYAAILRYYRVRYRIKHGSTIDAQSEPGASQSFTPSGAGTHARVTKPAALSESETHWVVEGSPDNTTFYELAEVAVGTTTYDDNEAPADYGENDISPLAGAYTKPTSYKYIIAAFNRVFGMGGWETGALQSSIYFTPAKGASDKADDERIPDTINLRNRVDLGEGIGGDGTGFAGPIFGAIYVFKYAQIWKLIPTGAASPAFDTIDVSLTRGALDQECIAVGEDAKGLPAIFFLDSQMGPMMVGAGAPVEIGMGVHDLWDSVNLAATTKAGWVIDYPAKGKVQFAWATGSDNDPTIIAEYTKADGSWDVFDTGGKIRQSRCAVLFARTLGASMSRDKVPYYGYHQANNTLLKGDTTDTSDDSTTFQAIVKSRPYALNQGQRFRVTTPWVLAKPADGVTLTVTVDCDFGRVTQAGTILLTAAADESGASRVWRRVEGIDIDEARVVQIQIGDASAVANSWTIERIYLPVERLQDDP